MNSEGTSTGRPRQGVPLLPRLLLLVAALVASLEWVLELLRTDGVGRVGARLLEPVAPVLVQYLGLRRWVLEEPLQAGALALLLALLLLAGVRYWLLFWHNQVVARLSGTRFAPESLGFPMKAVDLLREIGRRPPGQVFVGMSPSRGLLGWRWRPAYLSQRQKTMHRHVVGKTGSGKEDDERAVAGGPPGPHRLQGRARHGREGQ